MEAGTSDVLPFSTVAAAVSPDALPGVADPGLVRRKMLLVNVDTELGCREARRVEAMSLAVRVDAIADQPESCRSAVASVQGGSERGTDGPARGSDHFGAGAVGLDASRVTTIVRRVCPEAGLVSLSSRPAQRSHGEQRDNREELQPDGTMLAPS
jgi:hypothetical protein